MLQKEQYVNQKNFEFEFEKIFLFPAQILNQPMDGYASGRQQGKGHESMGTTEIDSRVMWS